MSAFLVNSSSLIWNPFQMNEAQPIKRELLDASDHFPFSLDLYRPALTAAAVIRS